MTVDEAKAMAEENEYDTEPNDEGEIEQRPGKLSDYIPSPYKNDQAARAANQGALPPDLSLMIKARHGGCNYVFSLLTGYPEDPPAGASVPAGLNFNPYFPGTGIGMARVLYDGLVEYEDGTPATTSQMAKDVVEFLNWTAEPEMDDRKRMGWKALTVSVFLFAISVWVKRYAVHSPTSATIRQTTMLTTRSGTNGRRSNLGRLCTRRRRTSKGSNRLLCVRLSGWATPPRGASGVVVSVVYHHQQSATFIFTFRVDPRCWRTGASSGGSCSQIGQAMHRVVVDRSPPIQLFFPFVNLKLPNQSLIRSRSGRLIPANPIL